jgi:cell division septation protein DedD
MRKVFWIAFFILSFLTSAVFSPATAQRQSATVSAKIAANSADGWNAAAHNSLPVGTLLHTSHIGSSRQVILKVVRKLPKNSPYALEISQAAADSLGISGTEATLRIEYIPAKLPRSGQVVAEAYREVNATRPQSDKKERIYYENEEVPAATTTQSLPEASAQSVNVGKTTTNTKIVASSAQKTGKATPDKSKLKTSKQEPFAPNGTYNTRGTKVAAQGFGLQLHAFHEPAKAIKEAGNLEKKKLGKVYIQVVRAGNKTAYRILLGEYASKATAEKAAKELQSKRQLKAIVKPHL